MIVEPPLIAFSSDELDQAWKDWRCNCGPAALAACLGYDLNRVRPHLGDFEQRGYMNVSMMQAAIHSAGFRLYCVAGMEDFLPKHGIVRVQWGGPWMKPGVPPKVAYNFTHWIAVKALGSDDWVFDVNSGWQPWLHWIRQVVPKITESIKRADGTWTWSHRWEVRKHRRE